MSVGTKIFSVWAALVGFWWLSADPASAPQQAALAGQVLVLIVIPYTLLASFQRSTIASLQDKLLSLKSVNGDRDSTHLAD